MATVNGSVCFAFSTIFTSKKDLSAYDLYLGEKMFPNINKNISIEIDKVEKYRQKGKIKFSKDNVVDSMIKKAIDNQFQNLTDKERKKAYKNEFIDFMIKEQGLGKRGIELIEDFTSIKTLGAFLNCDPEKLARKVQGKSIRQFNLYQKMGNEKWKMLEQTIKAPKKFVEIAIKQCFELCDIPEKNIKAHNADGYRKYEETVNDFPTFFIYYKILNDCYEMDALSQKVPNKEKRYAFEIKWRLSDIEWDKWTNRLIKANEILWSKAIGLAIPYVGNIIGSLVKKQINKKSCKNLEEEINNEFKEIFKGLLRENLGIDWLKFNNAPVQRGDVATKA